MQHCRVQREGLWGNVNRDQAGCALPIQLALIARHPKILLGYERWRSSPSFQGTAFDTEALVEGGDCLNWDFKTLTYALCDGGNRAHRLCTGDEALTRSMHSARKLVNVHFGHALTFEMTWETLKGFIGDMIKVIETWDVHDPGLIAKFRVGVQSVGDANNALSDVMR